MKAVVYSKYGLPEVLQIREIEKPIPKENEVLIKVHATTVTATDCVFRRGEPKFSRLFTGLTKPKNQVLGSEFAGEVEAIGSKVNLFNKGDKVFGTTPGAGSYQEYISLNAENLTALPFLRDKGKIQKGNEVLIIGASGSVGSAAVQLSHYFGADVTGVCSTSSEELVKSIGADNVIDYTKEDYTKSGQKFDIIFDAVGKSTFSDCKNLLSPNGKFLEAGITLKVFPSVISTSIFGSKKALIMATGLRPPAERSKDLNLIRELIEENKIKPVIDKTFQFEQIVEAHRYVDKGHKKGNVVILIGQ
ncbi:MAG: NAD(P)-dependent alcohol dehydrogenase [Ignavibacteriaceae bacterium]